LIEMMQKMLLGNTRVRAAALACLIGFVGATWAQETKTNALEEAGQAIAEARAAVSESYWERVEPALQAAEERLEGIDESRQGPLLDEIGRLREAATAGEFNFERDELIAQAWAGLDEARDRIDESANAESYLKDVELMLGGEEGMAYLPDEIRDAMSRRVTQMRQSIADRAAQQMGDEVWQKMADAQKKLPTVLKELGRQNSVVAEEATEELRREFKAVQDSLKDCPVDDPRTGDVARRLADAKGLIDGAVMARAATTQPTNSAQANGRGASVAESGVSAVSTDEMNR
jgi:hypothetical protein